jgi:hypothetical protein
MSVSVDKNKFLNQKVLSKTSIALFCVVGMLVSFLFSRALLSVFVILFGANGLRGVHPKEWLKQKWWLLGMAWITLYALSYFWSDDKHLWSQRIEVKLPVMLLPLAFAYLPAFSQRQLKIFTICGCLIFLSAAGYSISFLFGNLEYYLWEYHMAHVLPTPVYNDHIRFSLSVALFIIWCCYYFRHAAVTALKWLMGITVVLLSAYLHLLAARTGLLVWYMFVLGSGVYFGLKKNKGLAFGILIALSAVFYFTITHVPTLKKRVDYFLYTIELYNKGEISGLYSDMGRMISYDVSYRIAKENALTGVGSGDMMAEMKAGYEKWYPQITDEQVLLPHNQFMVVWLAGGMLALLLFVVWIFYPLVELKKSREGFYFFIVWLAMLLPLMVEPMFEVQFGVFVFLFFLLWQRHVMLSQNSKAEIQNV